MLDKKRSGLSILIIGIGCGFIISSIIFKTPFNQNSCIGFQDLNHIKNRNHNQNQKGVSCVIRETSYPQYTSKLDRFPCLRRWFRKLVDRQAPSRDPELIRFAHALIDPPSTHALRKLPWGQQRTTPQAQYVDKLLNGKLNGYFFEAGARDGERASNTLMLELKRNWTGLLVEIDPWFYAQMRAKLRHAYTVNVGLSPYDYVTELTLQESGGGLGKLVINNQHNQPNSISIPCIPLATLFWALNQTAIDYISLDVEGFENTILEHFPFSEFDVKTLTVERAHSDAKKLRNVMEKQGYDLVAHLVKNDPLQSLFVDDYMFRKRKT